MELESFKSFVDIIGTEDLLKTQRKPYNSIEDFILNIKRLKLSKEHEIKERELFLDSNFQIDGFFFQFCKENNYDISKIYTDFISLLADKDCKDYDPFVFFGGLIIKNDQFDFAVFSTIDEVNEDTQITATAVKLENYEQYLNFKSAYLEWIDKAKGVVINVVGGEDYILDKTYSWDSLYLGDKTELKKEMNSYIEGFLSNKKNYIDNDLSWKTSILITGGAGAGKTETINTIISNFNVKPITITPTNCDDTVIAAIFNAIAKGKNYMFVIEDIDILFGKSVISLETFIKLFDRSKTKTGLIVVATARTMTDSVKKFKFDKVYQIKEPDYNVCAELFNGFFDKEDIATIANMFQTEKFSYEYIMKAKTNYVLASFLDKEQSLKQLFTIIQSLSKENKFVNKKYLDLTEKKLGLV